MRLPKPLIIAITVAAAIAACLFAALLIHVQSIRSATAAAGAAGWTSDPETLRGRLIAQLGPLPDWGPVEQVGTGSYREIDTDPAGDGVGADLDASGRVTEFTMGDSSLSSLSRGVAAVVETAIPTATAADKARLKASITALVNAGHPGLTDFVTADGVTFSASRQGPKYQVGAKTNG
jgi:hypothetical protein